MRRVHILKSFVLIYNMDKNEQYLTLMSFSHHDVAYSR